MKKEKKQVSAQTTKTIKLDKLLSDYGKKLVNNDNDSHRLVATLGGC